MLYIEDAKIRPASGAIAMLSIDVRLRARQSNILVSWIECELKFRDRALVPPFKLGPSPRFIARPDIISTSAQIAIPNEAIQFIENYRTGDVSLTVEVKVSAQELKTDGVNSTLATLLDSFSSTGYTPDSRTIAIAHSDWLKHLMHLGWGEVALFEVVTSSLRQDKHLSSAIEQLKLAQSSFLSGEYESTLSACTKALDLASQVEILGTTQKGFEAILYRSFQEPEKRENLKPLFEAVQNLTKLGAKEKYPRLPFSRGEAAFCLRVTLSLFELISHQLATSSAPSISP